VSDQPASVVRKKVKPYPFDATVEQAAMKKPVEVIMVNAHGCIVRLKSGVMLSVGEHLNVIFELPVLHEFVNSPVRVMRTYDRSVDPKKNLIERLAELQFERLTEDHRRRILSFTMTIGQE
jgi:hypothetical protein